MRMVDLIAGKKRGASLTSEEIGFIIQGYMKGLIPDYQMSAFLMAVCFKGMNMEETVSLTMEYVNSGDTVDLSDIGGIKVDKHSSGGVGDKISLAVIAMCACAGIPVAKMSGRGLGHTGGTIDKLESIKGFRTELSKEEFISNVRNYKMAITGQSSDLTPADRKIYSLRDVTATVDSIPLIASSIMSKKIASGADCIVLDVKVGSGAFMKSLDKASELAGTMVEIGKRLGRRTVAVITDMNQPLGREVGNANEIKEVIEILKGEGAEDETEIALALAAHMAVLGEAFADYDTAYAQLRKTLDDGRALEKLKVLVKIQGGEVDVIDNPGKLPQAKRHIPVKSCQSGFVNAINAEDIGITAMLLGAGRRTREDVIDHAAGITMVKKVGDAVCAGDTLCILHTNAEDAGQAEKTAMGAYSFGSIRPAPQRYIYKVIQ